MTASGRYLRPTSLSETVASLRERPGAHLLAGGTDLLNDLRHGVLQRADVIDTAALEDLRGVTRTDDSVRIGAAVTMRELLGSGLGSSLAALQDAANLLGGRQIQAAATVGGNLCQASPAAEVATPLLVHAARATVAGPGGMRTLELADLFAGPRRTTLAGDELLMDVRMTARDATWSSAYRRIDLRRSVDIAIVSASVAVQVVGARVAAARVAVGAARPVPFLVPEAAAELVGLALPEERDATLRGAAQRAGALAAGASSPITDVRAGAEYRQAMVAVVVERAAMSAFDRAATTSRAPRPMAQGG